METISFSTHCFFKLSFMCGTALLGWTSDNVTPIYVCSVTIHKYWEILINNIYLLYDSGFLVLQAVMQYLLLLYYSKEPVM